jgi:hypothetical protein
VLAGFGFTISDARHRLLAHLSAKNTSEGPSSHMDSRREASSARDSGAAYRSLCDVI